MFKKINTLIVLAMLTTGLFASQAQPTQQALPQGVSELDQLENWFSDQHVNPEDIELDTESEKEWHRSPRVTKEAKEAKLSDQRVPKLDMRPVLEFERTKRVPAVNTNQTDSDPKEAKEVPASESASMHEVGRLAVASSDATAVEAKQREDDRAIHIERIKRIYVDLANNLDRHIDVERTLSFMRRLSEFEKFLPATGALHLYYSSDHVADRTNALVYARKIFVDAFNAYHDISGKASEASRQDALKMMHWLADTGKYLPAMKYLFKHYFHAKSPFAKYDHYRYQMELTADNVLSSENRSDEERAVALNICEWLVTRCNSEWAKKRLEDYAAPLEVNNATDSKKQ